MISKAEQFWINFIIRFAVGFLFLFAALEQFEYGPQKFAEDLSKPFATTWLGKLSYGGIEGLDVVKCFLFGTPYVMASCSALILTGILVGPALRVAALLLICLGLGKYMQKEIPTTASDFQLAFLVCVGIYFRALQKAGARAAALSRSGAPSPSSAGPSN